MFKTREDFAEWMAYEAVKENPMVPHFTYIMDEIFSLRDRVSELERKSLEIEVANLKKEPILTHYPHRKDLAGSPKGGR